MGRSVEWIKPSRGHRTLDPLQGSGPDPGSWAFLSSAVQFSAVQKTADFHAHSRQIHGIGDLF